MAIRDQFVSISELKEIIKVCEYLNDLSAEMSEFTMISAYVLEDELDGAGKTFPVRDFNGDLLGHIGYGEGEFVLYFDDGAE